MSDSKREKLDTILKELKSFVVAFSGGVDSSYLLYRANALKKTEMIGVTIRTPYIPRHEIDEAIEFAKAYGINHRIPYNTHVSESVLKMIEQAEYFLLDKGYAGTRVRIHGDLARIECLPEYFERITQNPDKELIINNLKKIGFRYISLDLEGYRTGSSNPEIDHL